MRAADRRTAVFVAVAAVLVFVAGVGSLARYHAGYPLNPIDLLARDTTAEGRRELRALRRDPVLDFRAPATRLRRSTDVAAGRDWKNSSQPTELRRMFTLKGEPGVAVDAYRVRAEAAGWRLHSVRCSLHFRSTSVRLTRSVAGHPVTLHLLGYLAKPPPESPNRGLLVTIEGEAPTVPADGPEGSGLARRDVHCLRAFDPNSPDLAPPALQPTSATAVCSLVTLGEAQKLVADVSKVEPTINAGVGCRYLAGKRQAFFVTDAPQPRAYYQDDRSPYDPGDRRFILLDSDTSGPPDRMWVETRIGPVQVYGRLDARQLVALAELLGRR
jgi:hypothetical protein